MVRLIYILTLSFFFAIGGYSQVMQTTGGAGGNKFRALKADSFLVVPKGTDTINLANPKWGESTTGALFVKTADSTLWFKVGGQWVQAGGNFTQTVIGNDTTIYDFVIDSTGAAANRVLFAGNRKIRSDSHFVWDSTNNKLVINHFNHSIGGVNTKLYVNGNVNLNGSSTTQNLKVSQIQQVFNDTTNYKPVIVNSSGDLYKLDRWPAGGGGSGTVTSFSAGTLSPLFTTSVATATTTPALSFSLSNAGSYTVFGNQTNASAAPSFAKLNINTIDATGTPSATTYLRGDGSWQTVSGGASIDSVAIRRYGTPNPNNIRSWNAGPAGAAASNVGSANTTTSNDSANIVIGYLAGNDLTSGYKNLFFGYRAGYKATTAHSNIGIGFNSVGGQSSTAFTGNGNIGIGIGTQGNTIGPLRNLTSGNNNIAIGSVRTASGSGFVAGAAITSGGENILIGAGAGTSVTTNSGNTMVGVLAGSSGTGAYNTLIGWNVAGNGSFSSSNNTIVGESAGANVTSGTLDAFGSNAGSSFSTGSRNFAIGSFSGFGTGSLVTGSDNTLFGIRSFQVPNSTTGITTSRNVSIGNYASHTSSTGANDNVIIGYAAGAGRPSCSGCTTFTGANNIAIGSVSTLPSLTSSNQITFWVGASGGSGGYNAMTRFTGGQWLINNTTSSVTAAPNASAALEINGTTGALIVPRLTTTQRDALTAAAGMIIFNTTTSKFQGYDGAAWQDFH